MTKNILVFSDGTGQDGGARPEQRISNIYKMYRISRDHADTAIDPYAAENPAEFFAVTSEYFFSAPDILATAYPQVYEQLRAFYRQDPLARLQHLQAHDPRYQPEAQGPDATPHL